MIVVTTLPDRMELAIDAFKKAVADLPAEKQVQLLLTFIHDSASPVALDRFTAALNKEGPA